MKRQTILSLVLSLSALLSPVTFSPAAEARQERRRFVADTGILTLGPNQLLRVAVTGEGKLLGNLLSVRFRRMEYAQGACGGDGVCVQTVASQVTSDPVALAPGEAALYDVTGGTPDNARGIRALVFCNSLNVRVTAQIIDTSTGEVSSHIIMANTEGDFH